MRIVYTKTDEAPVLATYSLFPIIQSFMKSAGVQVEIKDISLAGRIISSFPEYLLETQRKPETLTELAQLIKTPEANLIKLPNISASLPQLKAAIKELQSHGYSIPNFPDGEYTDPQAKEVRGKYLKILGSAVNPVLRDGNSDRRVASSVKQYAKSNPHKLGAWSSKSQSHVAHMNEGDFYSSEKSMILNRPMNLQIRFVDSKGSSKILKEDLEALENEVIDAAVMNQRLLSKFFKDQLKDAKEQNILWSLHLKSTMMKVSDPILFGEAVKAFFGEVFEKYASTLQELGFDPRNGLGGLYSQIQSLPEKLRSEIERDIQVCYKKGPRLAMVNSDKGITNLHVPNDVIIDASMPAAIRSSGKMWGADGQLHDTKALIPDRCYAKIYQEVIDFCKKYGAFDVTTMGSVSNVGLMAKKAEEYGSHDKTFQVDDSGTMKVVEASSGDVLIEHSVEAGDIWRMCQTKDVSVRDWVSLAVRRSRLTQIPAIFWLNPQRAHDANLIKKVKSYLQMEETEGLEISVMSPVDAMRFTLERVREGKDTISVTGNVLRDYLTDLFPILELGTSAKMLSIVPLLEGGGLFETGAGGSAPKHVQQFLRENHLRWNSLGEFLAIAISLEDLGEKTGNSMVKILAHTLDQANGQILSQAKSPSRNVGELDSRGSHFYLAMYWAENLSQQTESPELREKFLRVASELRKKEGQILKELNEVQGSPVDMGGYYLPDEDKLTQLMRPSCTFNEIIDSVGS